MVSQTQEERLSGNSNDDYRLPPGLEVNFLEALRKRRGAILFANSDWASDGWRSFIGDTNQCGTEAALIVRNER